MVIIVHPVRVVLKNRSTYFYIRRHQISHIRHPLSFFPDVDMNLETIEERLYYLHSSSRFFCLIPGVIYSHVSPKSGV